eukprot:gnl/Spiro4/14968_TR8073_c0_g2_i1.p1 gnl/Spiro4/14968_TR8073_c0_g2~~gnl/Spiro4/14968_TR8073_c0_g2_i1.p1  ORF type:complete len:691 (+),score=152.01 gnl/Spiro4/14968_TR8073_c0_g2_i1:58-2073(+)
MRVTHFLVALCFSLSLLVARGHFQPAERVYVNPHSLVYLTGSDVPSPAHFLDAKPLVASYVARHGSICSVLIDPFGSHLTKQMAYARCEDLSALDAPIVQKVSHSVQEWEESFDCRVCKFMFGFVGPAIRANDTDVVVQSLAAFVCPYLKNINQCQGEWQCKDLCDNIIREHLPEIIVIVSTGYLSPSDICGWIKVCPDPAPPPPVNVSGPVPVPSNCSDHAGEGEWPSWKLTSGEGYFVHITDFHMDPLYVEGTEGNCGQPLCCRARDGPPSDPATAAGMFGATQFNTSCDTAPAVTDSLFAHLAALDPLPDFVLFTGDAPPHDVWMQSRDWQLQASSKVASYMLKAFPTVPVFFALGNHESYPVNQFEGPGPDSWLYQAVVADWALYLPADAQRTMAYGGYYTARIRPGLRVVSLHTTVYQSGDWWLKLNYTDFTGQFPWLRDVLTQARALNEKVVVIGHGLPDSWEEAFSVPFSALVSEFSDVIMDGFFGHSHVARHTVFRDNATDTQPLFTGYLAGSVTTYTALNPTYRTYTYNRNLQDRNLATDFSQYVFDVDASNAQRKDLGWNLLLSAKAAFNLTDLSAGSWQRFYEQLPQNPDAIKKLIGMRYRGAVQPGGDNPQDLSCEGLSVRGDLYSKCMGEKEKFLSAAKQQHRRDCGDEPLFGNGGWL